MNRNRQPSLSERLGSGPDRHNFHISKKGRFSVRAFQIIGAVITIVLLRVQDDGLIKAKDMKDTIGFTWFVAVITMLLGAWGYLLYLLKSFKKKWSSRRVLIIEGICDISMTAILFGSFIAVVSKGSCAPGTQQCDRFNVLILFIVLLIISGVTSIFFDVQSFREGVWPSEKLEDLELRVASRRSSTARL